MTIEQAAAQVQAKVKNIPGVWGSGIVIGPDDRSVIEVAVKDKNAMEAVITALNPAFGAPLKYQGFSLQVIQSPQSVTYSGSADMAVIDAAIPAKFKTTVTEKTAIITGAEIAMGIVEAVVLVNIINAFARKPLRLPGWGEIARITTLLTVTGFIGGIISANIIKYMESGKSNGDNGIAAKGSGNFTGAATSFYRVSPIVLPDYYVLNYSAMPASGAMGGG